MVKYVFGMLLQLEFGELSRRGLPRSREAGEKVGQTFMGTILVSLARVLAGDRNKELDWRDIEELASWLGGCRRGSLKETPTMAEARS